MDANLKYILKISRTPWSAFTTPRGTRTSIWEPLV